MEKPGITLSINPSYLCNARCSFCYLTKEQLSDKTLLPIAAMSDMVNEVSEFYTIKHIDIYGGEASLLPNRYFAAFELMRWYHDLKTINIVTNLIQMNEYMDNPNFDISVSYDMEHRPHYKRTEENMMKMKRPFSVLMCLSEAYRGCNPMAVLDRLSDFPMVRSVEIKPYSANQSNNQSMTDLEYEEFVKNLIVYGSLYDIRIVNADRLKTVLRGEGHSYSDDHLYITPQGSFAVLDFDIQGKEFFRPIRDLEEYREWTFMEKERVRQDPLCSKCDYRGKCLSEHLRPNLKNAESCSGYYNLINWGKGYYNAYSYA